MHFPSSITKLGTFCTTQCNGSKYKSKGKDEASMIKNALKARMQSASYKQNNEEFSKSRELNGSKAS